MNAPCWPPNSPNAPRCVSSPGPVSAHRSTSTVATKVAGPTRTMGSPTMTSTSPPGMCTVTRSPTRPQSWLRRRGGHRAGAARVGDADTALPHPHGEGIGLAGRRGDEVDVDPGDERRLVQRAGGRQVDVLGVVDQQDEVRVADVDGGLLLRRQGQAVAADDRVVDGGVDVGCGAGAGRSPCRRWPRSWPVPGRAVPATVRRPPSVAMRRSSSRRRGAAPRPGPGSGCRCRSSRPRSRRRCGAPSPDRLRRPRRDDRAAGRRRRAPVPIAQLRRQRRPVATGGRSVVRAARGSRCRGRGAW